MAKVETILPVAIGTGYMHEEDNDLMEARQRVEKTALYLESLFSVINLSARFHESEGTENLDDYLADLQHVAEIGKGLASSIFDSLMPISSLEHDIEFNNRVINEDAPDILNLSNFSCEELQTNDLARHLSLILKAPELPEPLQEAIRESVIDLFNSDIDQSEFAEYEDSPEYLERILRGYKTKHGG